MNHLSTATDLSSSVVASAMAANSSGRSHQYAARRGLLAGSARTPVGCRHAPGNSVSEMGERMNGGAVRLDRSPETLAMLSAPSALARAQESGARTT